MAIFRLGFDALLLAAEFQTEALASSFHSLLEGWGFCLKFSWEKQNVKTQTKYCHFNRNSNRTLSLVDLTCIDSSRDSFKIWNPAGMFVASLLVFIYLFLIIIFRRKNNPINATGTTASTKIIKRCWRRSYSPKFIRVSIFSRWPVLF